MEISSVKQYFDEVVPAKIKENKDMMEDFSASYLFKVGDGVWSLVIKDGKGELTEGEIDNPDCTIEASEEDWLSVVRGELNSQMAFFQGKLKITGNIALSLKLNAFI